MVKVSHNRGCNIGEFKHSGRIIIATATTGAATATATAPTGAATATTGAH